MARFHSLIVYKLALENLRDVAHITARMHGFGDLVNQMRRAAISVVSNICEGAHPAAIDTSRATSPLHARRPMNSKANWSSWSISANSIQSIRFTIVVITSDGH